MALPNSGNSISLNQVNVELGRSGTQSINMNETAVRTLFAKTGSGTTISMSDGFGKANKTRVANATGGTITYDGDWQIHTFTSSGTFTLTQQPGTATTLKRLAVNGGDAGTSGDSNANGGSGASYRVETINTNYYTVNTGYTQTVGAGGTGFPGYGGGSVLRDYYGNYNPTTAGGGYGSGGYNSTPPVAGGSGYAGSTTTIGSGTVEFSGGGGGGGGGGDSIPDDYTNAFGADGGAGGSPGGGGQGGQGGSILAPYGGYTNGNLEYQNGSSGQNGQAYGAGGGGGGCAPSGGGTYGAGGNGSAGVVIIAFIYQQ